MTIKTYIFCFAFILATSVGCQSPTSDVEAESQGLLAEFSAHLLTPTAFTGVPMSADERKRITEHSIEDQMHMAELIKNASSWEVAHEGMQKHLTKSSELPDYIRKQRAAVFMLKAARSLDELTEAERAGVAEYTTMLAEYRSPEAALMLESLRKLDGYWSETQIRYAAARSLEGADTYLNKRYYCEGCPASKAASLSDGAVQETQDVFFQELLGSVDALRLIVDG